MPAFFAGITEVSAQETRGAIYGTVTDPNGAVIQGATVMATQQGTNLKFTATTGGDGDFRLPLLPVGNYELNISAANFRTFAQSDLNLRVGEERRLNVELNVPQADVLVDVESPPVTETTTATQSTVYNFGLFNLEKPNLIIRLFSTTEFFNY